MKVIYKAKNIVTDKVYIGLDSRWPARKHVHKVNALKNNVKSAFYNAIRKYGWDNFEWNIIEECNDKHEMAEREIANILLYNSLVPFGYNMTTGGEGRFAPHSEETKLKISKGRKGKKLTPEAIERGRLKRVGIKLNYTDESLSQRVEGFKKTRSENPWSTKKKVGAKIVAGGIHNWSADDYKKNGEKLSKTFWWTNGNENKRSVTAPDVNWVRGQKPRSRS